MAPGLRDPLTEPSRTSRPVRYRPRGRGLRGTTTNGRGLWGTTPQWAAPVLPPRLYSPAHGPSARLMAAVTSGPCTGASHNTTLTTSNTRAPSFFHGQRTEKSNSWRKHQASALLLVPKWTYIAKNLPRIETCRLRYFVQLTWHWNEVW